MASLKFGLNANKNGASRSPKPVLANGKAAFSNGSDSEGDRPSNVQSTENAVAQEISTLDDQQTPVHETQSSAVPRVQTRNIQSSGSRNRKKVPHNVDAQPSLSSFRDQSTVTEDAQSVDPSIYDYDAYYATSSSAIAAAKRAAAKADAAARVPKYMSNMHAAAETRKRDQLMARDKLLQREREKEGEDFGDKEKFVTGAYKQQQEEVRQAEEEEKRREAEEMRAREGKGMSGFYKQVMEDEDQRHREKVEASAKIRPNETSMQNDEQQDSETEAAQLARKLNAEGGMVFLNEEGQVTDKRQLLRAGLNVAPRPEAGDSAINANVRSSMPHREQPASNARRVDAKRAMRERQTRMLEAQLEAQAKRQAEEATEDLQKQQQTTKSKKTSSDISSAKERYLQRKEAAAAEAAGVE